MRAGRSGAGIRLLASPAPRKQIWRSGRSRPGARSGRRMNVQHEHADRVVDEASFAALLRSLAEDRREVEDKERATPSSPYGPDLHGWENSMLETFFDAAWSSWEGSMEAHGSMIGVQSTNPWTRAAHILIRGKFYE